MSALSRTGSGARAPSRSMFGGNAGWCGRRSTSPGRCSPCKPRISAALRNCDPEPVKPSALAEQIGRGGGAAAPNGKSRSRGIVMTFERFSTNRFGAFVASSLAAATLAASPASAAVTNIKTSSTVLDVALIVFGKPVDFGPVLPASGSAPPAYDVSNSLVSFSRSFDTPVGAFSLWLAYWSIRRAGIRQQPREPHPRPWPVSTSAWIDL